MCMAMHMLMCLLMYMIMCMIVPAYVHVCTCMCIHVYMCMCAHFCLGVHAFSLATVIVILLTFYYAMQWYLLTGTTQKENK